MARITLEHLTKDFPASHGRTVRALDSLSLDIADGEWLVLVGPSGCGKTTTLRLIAGLDAPTSGTVSLNSCVINDVPARARDMAMVFQSGALFPHLTAYENIVFGLQLRGTPREEARQQVLSISQLLRIEDCLDRKPSELSAGQTQRVALGRALVRNATTLLLDEPLANLDPETSSHLRSELLGLRGTLKTTAVFVTHDQQEAMSLGQRIAVLKQGALQQAGTAAALYNSPDNLFVAGFFGSPRMNLLEGTIVPCQTGLAFRTQTNGTATPLTVLLEPNQLAKASTRKEKAVTAGIRPEHLALMSESPSDEVGLRAGVELVELTGPDKLVHLNANGSRLIARVRQNVPIRANETVRLRIEPDTMHLFDPETGKTLR